MIGFWGEIQQKRKNIDILPYYLVKIWPIFSKIRFYKPSAFNNMMILWKTIHPCPLLPP